MRIYKKGDIVDIKVCYPEKIADLKTIDILKILTIAHWIKFVY